MATTKNQEQQEKLREYFLDYMRKNVDKFYFHLAGMKKVSVRMDTQIEEKDIRIAKGSWGLYDERGKSGTYLVCPEFERISKITLVHPEKSNIDYSQEPIECKVGAFDLMYRYLWFYHLFTNYAHRREVNYSTYAFEDSEDISQKFNDEKTYLAEDPYLALYWLMHFGFSLDKRYQEVKDIVVTSKYKGVMKKRIEGAMAFFDHEDIFEALDIYSGKGNKYSELDDAFLERRAYLIYSEQVYKNYNPENLHHWWLSIQLYPKFGKHLIYRMRWLKNNVEKCHLWNEFEALLTPEDKNIPLLSYVFATNPNKSQKDREVYANQLLQEILDNKKYCKSSSNYINFLQAFIWDVREFADKALLKDATDSFFIGAAKIEQEYKDILQVLGESIPNEEALMEGIEGLRKIEAKYEEDDEEELKKAVLSYFDSLNPTIFHHVSIAHDSLAINRMAILYTCLNPIKNKGEVLIALFDAIQDYFMADFEFKYIFGEHSGHLIKSNDDENIEAFKILFNKKLETIEYDDEFELADIRSNYLRLFINALHFPNVFNYIIELTQIPSVGSKKGLISDISMILFKEDYGLYDSTLLLSKEQVEAMFESIIQWILSNEKFYDEMSRPFYHCKTQLAKEWLEERVDNDEWLAQFSHIKQTYMDDTVGKESVDEELRSGIKSALENIA